MTILFRDVSLFFLAGVTAKGLGVLKAFWLARILDPAEFGIWVFLLLTTSFAPILSLGTVETLMKKVPFFRGKGDLASAREIEEAVFTFMLIVALALFLAGIPARAFLSEGPYQKYALPAQLMLFATSFSLLSAFLFYRLQSYQRFDLASAVTTARSVLVLVCQIPLGYIMGLTGVFVGFLLSEVLVLGCSVFLNTRLPKIATLRFGFSLYGVLIRTGLPITIVWWTYMIQTSVDRIVSMSMLGEAPTGYYGIGMSIALTFLLLPDSINQVLYPSVNKEYGRTMSSRSLSPLVVDPAYMMSIFLPFLACISVVVLPFIFTIIVPKYLPGLVTAQLLVVAALYTGIMRGGTNLLISIDKQWLLLSYIGGAVVTNLCGTIVFVKLGLGIEGIALSTVISSALLNIAVWVSVFRALGSEAKASIASALDLFAPAMLFTLLTIISQVFFKSITAFSLGYFTIVGVQIVLNWSILLAIPHYRKLIVKAIRSLSEAIGKMSKRQASTTAG